MASKLKLTPVYVTLLSITPLKVNFDPPELPVDRRNGKVQTVTWKRKGGMDFTFAALTFFAANPFKSAVVNDDSISAVDENENDEVHFYSVIVKANHAYYNSRDRVHIDDSPTIRNK